MILSQLPNLSTLMLEGTKPD